VLKRDLESFLKDAKRESHASFEGEEYARQRVGGRPRGRAPDNELKETLGGLLEGARLHHAVDRRSGGKGRRCECGEGTLFALHPEALKAGGS
jgi:hypothetical protein